MDHKLAEYITDVEQANRLLEAVTRHCVYRINDLCWEKCEARGFCVPDAHGLKTVVNLEGKI